jgi:hypothetical protein
LTINDVPPGWTESPNSSSGDTNLSKYGKTCAALQKKADVAKKLRSAHGKSPDFKQGSADQISNTVSAYRTDAGAKAALTVLTNPAVAPCLQKGVNDLIKKNAQSGVKYSSSVGRVSVPQVGDDTVGYEFTITASQNGATFKIYIDMQLVLVGRAGMTFTFEGERASPMLANQSLVQASVARVQAAEVANS